MTKTKYYEKELRKLFDRMYEENLYAIVNCRYEEGSQICGYELTVIDDSIIGEDFPRNGGDFGKFFEEDD